MAGTIGPLETRPKTDVETVTDLAFLDASPFDSGERSFVRSFQETFQLRRDSVAVVDNVNVVSVGPNSQGQGRWIRECFLCGEGCPNSAFFEVSNFLTSSTTFIPFLTGTINITVGNFLEALFTMSGSIIPESTAASGAAFTIQLDGEIIPIARQSSSFLPVGAAQNILFGSSIVLRKFVTSGIHIVTVYAKTLGSPCTLSIRPIANPDTHHANLYLEEVCSTPIQ